MARVIIIHGTKGSPEINWFPWLSSKLTERGVQVLVPQMPTPEGQTLSNWLTTLRERAGQVDASTVVIGHSIGATFLLRYLEQATGPIGGSIFVAGLTGALGIREYDALNSSFVSSPFQWDKIRTNAGKILCLSGDNDPYVPLEQGIEIATNLNTEACVIPGGGHLNSEFGYTKFPLLLQRLTKLLE